MRNTYSLYKKYRRSVLQFNPNLKYIEYTVIVSVETYLTHQLHHGKAIARLLGAAEQIEFIICDHTKLSMVIS